MTAVNEHTFLVEEGGDCPHGGKKEATSLSNRMLKTRTILLCGEINKDLAEKTIRQLLLLENMGDDPVRIFIDSPGGETLQ